MNRVYQDPDEEAPVSSLRKLGAWMPTWTP